MSEVPREFWWLAVFITVCINGILIPAGGFIGAWLFNKFWPALQANREKTRNYRQSTENAALDIAKETIAWSRKEFTDQQAELAALRQAVEKLIQIDERRAKSFTLQNGILSDMSVDLRSQQANIVMIVNLLEQELNKNDST